MVTSSSLGSRFLPGGITRAIGFSKFSKNFPTRPAQDIRALLLILVEILILKLIKHIYNV
jgi:hypothetical protein